SLKAIIFKEQREDIPLYYLKNGLKVLVYGKITFFPRTGEIYINTKKIEPLGIGLIFLKKEFLLKKYEKFFDPKLKRALPSFPSKIALITSLFGAALQDFLKISAERWGVHILVYPVKVQGEGAHLEIVQAIKDLNQYFPDLDLIVITRGGGSLEDLAPFYTEELILAIRASQIPIVSAVGHEIDITLCDLAADKRCPTPSAAAHEILPHKGEYLQKLYFYKNNLLKLVEKKLIEAENKLKVLQMDLIKNSPLNYFNKIENFLREGTFKIYQKINTLLQVKENSLSFLKRKLEEKSPKNMIDLKEEQLKGYKKLLFSLSPYNILERGYSIVKDVKKNKVIKSAYEVEEGELLEIILHKGKLYVKVVKKSVGKLDET
ncbi:MAG: exodeoxyribonuclease VII large subunit, partial [Caldimicrobium sp.]